LRIVVEERGWAIKDSGDWFETLHSLLMHTSEGYKQSFSDSLNAKLLGLLK
jgi:hypothetical protein